MSAMSQVICSCEECFQTHLWVPDLLREKTERGLTRFLLWEEPSIWGLRELGQAGEFLAFGPAGSMRIWCCRDLIEVPGLAVGSEPGREAHHLSGF